jgi:hypothetical protein
MGNIIAGQLKDEIVNFESAPLASSMIKVKGFDKIAAVHLLPALSQRPVAWVLWIGCLLCAIYGHLVFFTYASLRAGDVRAQYSVRVIGAGRD